MSETRREPWATEAYADYQKYRGPFGPKVEEEAEAAFFNGLRRGLETNAVEFRWGQPPWKVEDAFDVWLLKRHYGGKVDAQISSSMKAAFLAGAEYGAAAGSEGGPSENRTDAPSGGRGASVEGESNFFEPRPLVSPTGDTHECAAVDPESCSAAADVNCFFLRGHPLRHSWELKDLCLAFRSDVDLAIRAFCCYVKGHPGIHSWELPAQNPKYQDAYHAIPSREEWKLERCRTLVFAILGGISTSTADVRYGDFLDPVAEYVRELGELWETM